MAKLIKRGVRKTVAIVEDATFYTAARTTDVGDIYTINIQSRVGADEAYLLHLDEDEMLRLTTEFLSHFAQRRRRRQ